MQLIQGKQIDFSLIENTCTAKIFALPTLIQKLKHVVLLKYEFDYRHKRKSKCFFFRKIRTTGTLMHKKNKEFSVVYSSTIVVVFNGGNRTGGG